jgi:hypothetical protein
MPALHTGGSGFGSSGPHLAPYPVSSGAQVADDPTPGQTGGTTLDGAVRVREGLWPTPRSSDGEKGGPNQRGSKGDLMLPAAVHQWPTPHGMAVPNARQAGPSGNELGRAVNQWATPTSHERTHSPRQVHHGQQLANQAAGGGPATPRTKGPSLNPSWVEWLMGWPIGWTACEPLATDRFPQWLRSHGCCSHRRTE